MKAFVLKLCSDVLITVQCNYDDQILMRIGYNLLFTASDKYNSTLRLYHCAKRRRNC